MTELQNHSLNIARFMGYRDMTTEEKIKWLNCHTEERLNKTRLEHIPMLTKGYGEPLFIDSIDYSKDWNYLMGVIEKIENIEEHVSYISSNNCIITTINFNPDEGTHFMCESHHPTDKILAVYESVIKFINYYNDKSK